MVFIVLSRIMHSESCNRVRGGTISRILHQSFLKTTQDEKMATGIQFFHALLNQRLCDLLLLIYSAGGALAPGIAKSSNLAKQGLFWLMLVFQAKKESC